MKETQVWVGWGREMLLIACCATGLALLQTTRLNRLIRGEPNLTAPKAEAKSQQTQFGLKVLEKTPSLGFDNLVADWTFLNFLQYFGNRDERKLVGYQLSPDFFRLIVNHDPRFSVVYPYLSISTSLFAAHPEKSVALIAQGLAFMAPQVPPDSYTVWREKGIDELLFLGDSQAAQQSYQTAADWARQSPDPNALAIAKISQDTADFLAKNPNSKAAQISSWAQVLAYAKDDYTRHIAVGKIRALGGEIIVNQQGRATVRYRIDQ